MRPALRRFNNWVEALPAWQGCLFVFAVVVPSMAGLLLADGARLGGAFTSGLICGAATALISLVGRAYRTRRYRGNL